MSTKSEKDTSTARWVASDQWFRDNFPQISAVVDRGSEFRFLRISTGKDGTTMAVLGVTNRGGTAVVCFGSGYGFMMSLMALEGTVAAGDWRLDKYAESNQKLLENQKKAK